MPTHLLTFAIFKTVFKFFVAVCLIFVLEPIFPYSFVSIIKYLFLNTLVRQLVERLVTLEQTVRSLQQEEQGTGHNLFSLFIKK